MGVAAATRRRHAVFHRLRVSRVDRLTDDAVAVTFAVPAELAEDYRFRPGQHLTVRCTLDGVEVRRNYSICTSAVGGPLRVAVKRLAGGTFSAYAVESLAVGDELEVMTPTGTFTVPLDPGQARHYAAIAAGSGITPVLSILSTVLDVEPESRCTLLYGNRTSSSVLFLDELADLKDRWPSRLQLVHVLSRESPGVDLCHGRMDAERLPRLLAALLPPSTVDEWLLCGPAGLVRTAREVLAASGVPARNVRFELFHAAEAEEQPRGAEPAVGGAALAGAPGSSEVTALLDGRATTFPLARDGERILDAVLRLRGDAPYACKGGVCGTCRARLVEGRVEMARGVALAEEEIAAGVVLTCQSHPASDRVVVDFDA
ncbi:MAG TPA: 1,2-phenylacetyl-CoA epoxidase subunit PaaE [Mycobacteriales bacterium]|nr:1,2-phenylacetyl-CoA epoxidase subunit PaaE [Mycobacteriales bacterium]